MERVALRTPFGFLGLEFSSTELFRIRINPSLTPGLSAKKKPDWLRLLLDELDEYFTGQSAGFSEFPLLLNSLEPLERCILGKIQKIPFGKTTTYGGIARDIKSIHYARVVGRTCARNPFPILIPCHRVCAVGGLGGYSGGLEIKKYLLKLEGAIPVGRSFTAAEVTKNKKALRGLLK